jgi:sporulation protein YlmC with PRC-barrel domain
MRFRDVELRGIPVITKSGQKVGKLSAYVIDADRHEVAQYVVVRSRLLSRLLPDELLVDRSQVVSLDAEMMVINDNAVTERAEARKMIEQAAEAATGAAQMTREPQTK